MALLAIVYLLFLLPLSITGGNLNNKVWEEVTKLVELGRAD